jgi:hypothetical protein
MGGLVRQIVDGNRLAAGVTGSVGAIVYLAESGSQLLPEAVESLQVPFMPQAERFLLMRTELLGFCEPRFDFRLAHLQSPLQIASRRRVHRRTSSLLRQHAAQVRPVVGKVAPAHRPGRSRVNGGKWA